MNEVALGDVAGILDSAGSLVVEYRYDAWGRATYASDQLPISNWLCLLNPFRYRGYIYDSETGMYYLRSRYYNPEIGRFLNADTLLGCPGVLLVHNLSAYCENDPVSVSDPDGMEPSLFYFYGADQKKHARSNIKDLRKSYDVHGYLVESTEEFMNAWSEMYDIVGEDDIDVVVANLHGNPFSIDYLEPDQLDFSKRIDTFVLLSCNAGNLHTGGENVAEHILRASNNSINQLIAADGTHFRGTFWHPFRGIKVKGDKTWKFYNQEKGQKSKGFVNYKRNEEGLYDLTSIGKAFSSVKNLLKKVGW